MVAPTKPGGLPPAGWYPDPHAPGRLRWWTGEAWGPPQPEEGPRTASRLPLALLAIGVFVLALMVAAGSGFAGFLSTVGVAAFVVGIVALARKGIPALRIASRPLATAILAGGVVLVLVGGSVRGASPESVVTSERRGLAEVSETSEPPSTPADPSPRPTVRTDEVVTTESIPFDRVTVEDPNVAQGTSTITTAGVDGVRTLTFEVEYTDGVETSRRQVGEEVTTPPVSEVTTIGTMVPRAAPPAPPASGSGCDPNYTGCVPIASDVDCAGGSGNGPAYADGPVTVIGRDIYDLDSDGDGTACE